MTAALPKCHTCGRQLTDGEDAWADDFTVIDISGVTVSPRIETRYTCDDCEANR